MEIKNSQHKINNKNGTMDVGGDIVSGDKIVNITYNYYQSEEETYSSLTSHNNYTEFYKRYIANFNELNNYIVDTFFPCSISKKYEFTSEKLVFAKKIIDWIFGNNAFPESEIQKFYENIKVDFEFDEKSILIKRWKANSFYFKNDFKNANKEYSDLFDEIIARKDLPTWYIDDVSVDGRNILLESREKHNIFETKYYKKLQSNKHKLSYPDIDRVKVEIYEDVQKTIFNNKNKGKYTTYFGIGLDKCFSQIQNLIYMTIFYGSITHLKIVRQLIANVMYMYAETFNDREFYKLTLKMLYLSGDFKRYNSLYEKIKLKYRFVNDIDFINILINSNKSLFEFEKDKHIIFIFKTYGYYLEDKKFDELEQKIINLLNSENTENYTKIECLNAISRNMIRINKVNEIMDYIIKCFKNNHIYYYTSFGNIINSIKINDLGRKGIKKIKKIIDFSLKNKGNINYDISHCIVELKKYKPKIKKYDKLIFSIEEKIGLIYKIENDEDTLVVIKEIVKILKERHEQNEKNPSVSTEYMDDYRIGKNIFDKERFNEEVKSYFEDEFILFSEDILLSKNETIYEKLKIIKLLMHMLKKDYSDEIKQKIIFLIEESEKIDYKSEYGFSLFREKNLNELKINVMSARVLSGDLSLEGFLCKCLELIMLDENNIEEILLCILNIDSYIELNEEIINYLYIILKKGFNSDDYDIKNLSIELFSILLKSSKKEEIITCLLSDCSEITQREFRGYYQLIQKVDETSKKDLNKVMNQLKEHKNYFIKTIANSDL
mgnify:CR=1 FL=1